MLGFAAMNNATNWGGRESWLITPLIVLFFVTMTVQISSTAFPIAILIAFMICGVLYYGLLLQFVVKKWVILIFPFVVIASTIWSDAPSASFWYGAQLCVTVCIGILLGLAASSRQLISGIFLAMICVVAASIVWGRTGPSEAGPVLIGVTGSKDMMGFAGLTLMASGLGVLFDGAHRWGYRLVALASCPLGAYIATHVESAAPMVSAGGFAVTFLCITASRYFGRIGRCALLLFMTIVAVPLTLAIVMSSGVDTSASILKALNKDETLSGRTILWRKADEWISRAPEIGHGYRAFWMGTSSDARGVLQQFHQIDASGFEFHNTAKEILVDTGWLGLIGFIVVAITFVYDSVMYALAYPGARSAFIASTYLLILARAPIESILEPFSSYTALFYACGTVAAVTMLKTASSRRVDRMIGARMETGGGSRFRRAKGSAS